MKTTLGLALAALAIIGAILMLRHPTVPSGAPAETVTTVATPTAPALVATTPRIETKAEEATGQTTAQVKRLSGEQAIQRIEAAVVTYEAASLPVIAPYLTDPDPELRRAAREGMLQMGAAEASPLLRAAAGELKDPREATLLLDAADFLDLPPLASHSHPGRLTTAAPPPRPPGTPSPR